MNVRNVLFLLLLSFAVASCQKNEISKIPQIGILNFGPKYVRVNVDTLFLQLNVVDGDADLGVDLGPGKGDIYVKDFRFDTGYAPYPFPEIDRKIEEPKKGITGKILFMFTPFILSPRTDSIHVATGDTTNFEIFIKDRAGNESNHIITEKVIMVY